MLSQEQLRHSQTALASCRSQGRAQGGLRRPATSSRPKPTQESALLALAFLQVKRGLADGKANVLPRT
jgi:hypothetical protein